MKSRLSRLIAVFHIKQIEPIPRWFRRRTTPVGVKAAPAVNGSAKMTP